MQYFCCIIISQFWNVEILLRFNLAFSQCSTGINQAFDHQTEISPVFSFTISWCMQKYHGLQSHIPS